MFVLRLGRKNLREGNGTLTHVAVEQDVVGGCAA